MDRMRMRNWNRAAAAAFLLMAACVFDTKTVDPGQPGYLSLELVLRPGTGALLKASSADTLFRLDSLIVILSAPGAATTSNAYAIGGRADSSSITVTPGIFALAAQRAWKAKILSIDTTLNPSRKDTVHIDSVTFTINPGDTAYVTKSINPVFSILRARMVSNSPASLANNVKYVRVRVDGTTRDSTAVGPNLRAVDFGSNSTGYAAGDSGMILRTTNNGINWAAVASATAQNLHGVSFTAANSGWAVGAAGTVVKTTTGTAWSIVTSGTSQTLNAVSFTSTNTGWAVGNAGTLLKTTTGTAFSAQSSGTSRDLRGVYFSTSNIGTAVGVGGTILRTANGGTAWTLQASGTARNLNAVCMPASVSGFAVGDGGTILRTLNSGTTWTALASGTTADLNAVFFTSATTGYAVGDGGVILTTSDGTTWTLRASGTVQNLNGIAWTSNGNNAAAVGNLGSISASANGTSYAHQLIGTKSFDLYLTYKYFTPNVPHTLLLDAIDTLSGNLRGYQVSKAVLLAPGRDSTVTPGSSLAKCGYGGTNPACAP